MSITMGIRIAAGIGLALLVGAFLWQRNDLTATKAAYAAEQRTTADLRADNKSLAASLATAKEMRADNDKIAADVATAVGAIKTRETHTNTIYTEAKRNDPVAANWASMPIPDSVRQAIATPGKD